MTRSRGVRDLARVRSEFWMRSRLIAMGAVSAAAALVAMTMTDEVWQLAVLSVAAGLRWDSDSRSR